MRHATLLTSTVLLACLLPACVDIAMREDRRELLAADKEFSDRVAREGLRALEDFYDEDAIYLPAYSPMIEGRDNIVANNRAYYDDPTIRLRWTPLRAEVAASRDMGWTIGTYEFSRTDEAGATITRHGKYVTVWSKQEDGGWKAIIDGGSPDERPGSGGAAKGPETEPAAAPPSGP